MKVGIFEQLASIWMFFTTFFVLRSNIWMPLPPPTTKFPLVGHTSIHLVSPFRTKIKASMSIVNLLLLSFARSRGVWSIKDFFSTSMIVSLLRSNLRYNSDSPLLTLHLQCSELSKSKIWDSTENSYKK